MQNFFGSLVLSLALSLYSVNGGIVGYTSVVRSRQKKKKVQKTDVKQARETEFDGRPTEEAKHAINSLEKGQKMIEKALQNLHNKDKEAHAVQDKVAVSLVQDKEKVALVQAYRAVPSGTTVPAIIPHSIPTGSTLARLAAQEKLCKQTGLVKRWMNSGIPGLVGRALGCKTATTPDVMKDILAGTMGASAKAKPELRQKGKGPGHVHTQDSHVPYDEGKRDRNQVEEDGTYMWHPPEDRKTIENVFGPQAKATVVDQKVLDAYEKRATGTQAAPWHNKIIDALAVADIDPSDVPEEAQPYKGNAKEPNMTAANKVAKDLKTEEKELPDEAAPYKARTSGTPDMSKISKLVPGKKEDDDLPDEVTPYRARDPRGAEKNIPKGMPKIPGLGGGKDEDEMPLGVQPYKAMGSGGGGGRSTTR